MNLVLLRAEEVADDGTVELRDARAQHIAEVITPGVGTSIRVGMIDGPEGFAEVLTVDRHRTVLRCAFSAELAPRPRDVLLLAVPRPKVLRRCLTTAAALGYGRIVLVRTWRVDPTHLQSRALRAHEIEAALLDGLAQARRTFLPAVQRFDRFRPFVEDELEGVLAIDGPPPPLRYVGSADDERSVEIHDIARPSGPTPFALALGPERGFVPYEVSRLCERGFRSVRAGASPLTVETALAVVTGQLRMLHATTHAHSD